MKGVQSTTKNSFQMAIDDPKMVLSGGSGKKVLPTAPFPSLLSNPWFYSLLACFLLIALFGTRLIADADLGFHLKGGQWILENHRVPAKDAYTYTVSGHDYVDIQWLYQVLLYSAFWAGGYSSLTLVNIALVAISFALTFWRLRMAQTPFGVNVVLLWAAIIASETRFEVRPEIASWVLMCSVLWVLEMRIHHDRNYLFLLPFIEVIWVNIEGLFMICWGLMIFYLVSGFIHNRRLDKKLLQFSVLSFACCLLNPYFFTGVAFPLTLLQSLGSGVFKSVIDEFQPPWTMAGHSLFVPSWSLWTYKIFSLLLVFVFLMTLKKRKIHEFFLLVCFFCLSAAAQRNISLFMLACTPIAASCCKDLKWGWFLKLQSVVSSKPVIAWLFTFFVLGISLRVVTNAYYVSDRRIDRFGLGLDLRKQPVRSAQFLVQNNLGGRILNDMNSGGWLDWKGPQKTYVDGRLEVMGPDFFSEYLHSLQPGGLAPVLAKYGTDILFFNPNSCRQWLFDLKQMPDWRPVYLDETTVIYLRKGYAAPIPDLDDAKVLMERGISPSILTEAPGILRMQRPPVLSSFVEGFYRPATFAEELNTIGSYYFFINKVDFAEAVFLERIRRTQGRYFDLVFNLGALDYNSRQFQGAYDCMKLVLEEQPGFIPAQKIMETLQSR